jgi:uncharacterized RDD family membrane protein YckC
MPPPLAPQAVGAPAPPARCTARMLRSQVQTRRVSQPWSASSVVTGEAVAVELRPAALPSRVVAGSLDALLQLVLLLALGAVAFAVAGGLSDAGAGALLLVVVVAVLIGYPVVFETLLRGRTPGKAAMGLRVVRDDGGPIGFRQAFVRGLAGAFVERPGVTFFVAGVVTMLLNSTNKRLGDLLAGTLVLQERVAGRDSASAVMPAPLAGWAAALDLSALPDDVALAARQFLARSGQLTPAARDDVGGRLVAAVTEAVRPPPPPGTPGWAVVAAVLAERRRREEQRLGAHRPPVASVSEHTAPAAGSGRTGAPPPATPVASVSEHTAAAAASGRDEQPPERTAGGFAPPD